MIRIDDPRQNQHCWCGILSTHTIFNEKKSLSTRNHILKSSMTYAFLKTSREAHYISQGTVVKRVRVLSKSEIEIAIDNIIEAYYSKGNEKIRTKILNDIKGCLSEAGNVGLIEILELDDKNTSPLSLELNNNTKTLFTDPKWLNKYGARIGADAIRVGMSLPGLPKSKKK